MQILGAKIGLGGRPKTCHAMQSIKKVVFLVYSYEGNKIFGWCLQKFYIDLICQPKGPNWPTVFLNISLSDKTAALFYSNFNDWDKKCVKLEEEKKSLLMYFVPLLHKYFNTGAAMYFAFSHHYQVSIDCRNHFIPAHFKWVIPTNTEVSCSLLYVWLGMFIWSRKSQRRPSTRSSLALPIVYRIWDEQACPQLTPHLTVWLWWVKIPFKNRTEVPRER